MGHRLSWEFEDRFAQAGYMRIAGVDEAGRGCLAGIVVAGAVVFLNRGGCPQELNDSKKLSRTQRQVFFEHLTGCDGVAWAVGIASVEEIDRLNILQASHLAMERALTGLKIKADYYLIDGLPVERLGKHQRALIGGDGRSPSIAAASIIAKETRDRLMEELDREHPVYGFAKHKGYGTREHLSAIRQHGICPAHRRSFAPVSQMELF